MNKQERADSMVAEFRAVLRAILIFLESGQTETAIRYIKDILKE